MCILILIAIQPIHARRIHTHRHRCVNCADDDMYKRPFWLCVCFCITISFACHSVCAYFWNKKQTRIDTPNPCQNHLVFRSFFFRFVLFFGRPPSAMSQTTQQHIPRFYHMTITQNTQLNGLLFGCLIWCGFRSFHSSNSNTRLWWWYSIYAMTGMMFIYLFPFICVLDYIQTQRKRAYSILARLRSTLNGI